MVEMLAKTFTNEPIESSMIEEDLKGLHPQYVSLDLPSPPLAPLRFILIVDGSDDKPHRSTIPSRPRCKARRLTNT
jgi:hypothetical protein